MNHFMVVSYLLCDRLVSVNHNHMRFWKRLQRTLFALHSGPAHRVIFYYYGEDPTYLEDAFVTVYRNGVVEVLHRSEHVSTHAQNVEILWKGKRAISNAQGRSLSLVKTDAQPQP